MVYKSTDRLQLKTSRTYHLNERNWHKSGLSGMLELKSRSFWGAVKSRRALLRRHSLVADHLLFG